ncbi:MAG: hypothetical protein COT17_07310 [Elusimicrobia bacterium CG08_land_8_20_14_0_20_51_18]|nr:MAG: hypothetical protein COT17_07310 [Elusimicrobia bacterium CG08_land_8_20_14_0_20_51_18]
MPGSGLRYLCKRYQVPFVHLSSSQVKKFQAAIVNNSKLEQTMQNMRSLSQKICEATTTGVKKRKS